MDPISPTPHLDEFRRGGATVTDKPPIHWTVFVMAFVVLASVLALTVTAVSRAHQLDDERDARAAVEAELADVNDTLDATVADLDTANEDLAAAADDLADAEGSVDRLQAAAADRAAACSDLDDVIDRYNVWVTDLLTWMQNSLSSLYYDVDGEGDRIFDDQTVLLADLATARRTCIGTGTV